MTDTTAAPEGPADDNVAAQSGIRIMAHGTPGLAIGELVRIGWLRIGERLVPRAEPRAPASQGHAKQ